MDIVKVTTENNGIYLIKEVHTEQYEDVYYGYLINLSQKIIITEKTGSKTGSFHYFNDKPIRIAAKENVVKVEEPTDLDLKFVELLKEKRRINYSRTIVDEYNLQDIIKIEYV